MIIGEFLGRETDSVILAFISILLTSKVHRKYLIIIPVPSIWK